MCRGAQWLTSLYAYPLIDQNSTLQKFPILINTHHVYQSYLSSTPNNTQVIEFTYS